MCKWIREWSELTHCLSVISTKPIGVEKDLIHRHFPTAGDFKAEISIDFYLDNRSYVKFIYPERQGNRYIAEQLDCVLQDSGFFCKSEVAAHIFRWPLGILFAYLQFLIFYS